MGVIITKSAEGLKIDQDGDLRYLSQPTVKINDGPIPTVTFTSSSGVVNMSVPITNLTTIGGNPPAATNDGLLDQITALLNNPAGAATSGNQVTGNTALATLNANVGAKADDAATSDTGAFSIIAFIKRNLVNWTSLLAKIPALSAGRLPVEANTPNAFATGNVGALNAAITLTLAGLAGVGIKITGNLVGTLQFEGTIDGVNWTPISAAPLVGGVRQTTTTVPGDFEAIGSGLQQVRVKCTAFTSGTATVYILGTSDTRIRRVWSTSADNFLVKPSMTGGGNVSVGTHATAGATYVPFAGQACSQLTVVNDTGVNLELQQGGAGVALPVFANTAYTFFGLTDASNLAVRRTDQVATSLSVKARWES